MYEMIEIINSCFEACIIMFYLDRSLSEKPRYGKSAAMIAAAVMAAILSLAALTSGAPTVQIITTFLLMLITASVIYDERLIKRLFTAGIFIVIIFVSESLFMCLLYLLNFGTPEDLSSDNIGRIIGMLGSKILYFWFSVYVCHFLNMKIKEISLKNWAAMICIPLLSVIILNSIFIASEVSDKSMLSYTASVTGILLLNFFAFDYFDSYNRQLKLAIMEKVLEADKENYRLIENKYNEIRRLKHDIQNQIAVAEKAFEYNKDEGMKHLDRISAELSKADGICCIGIPALDAIINVKLDHAADKGIKCYTKISVDKDLGTDIFVLCRILANALDNAIEACERYEADNKFIYFVMSKRDTNLFIRISNSSHYVNVNSLETEKNDRIQHGIGLKSISEAVRQINGIINITYENNIFTTELLIIQQPNGGLC